MPIHHGADVSYLVAALSYGNTLNAPNGSGSIVTISGGTTSNPTNGITVQSIGGMLTALQAEFPGDGWNPAGSSIYNTTVKRIVNGANVVGSYWSIISQGNHVVVLYDNGTVLVGPNSTGLVAPAQIPFDPYTIYSTGNEGNSNLF